MNEKYRFKFADVHSFHSDMPEEVCGKIRKVTLHVELQSGIRYKLTLHNPKAPSEPSTTVSELLNSLDTKSGDSFEVIGKQHEPGFRNSDMLWRMILLKDDYYPGSTIRCYKIDGLPDEGWQKN